MKLKIPKIRPINRSDLNNFKHFGHSVRGYIIELDGEYRAVFGVLQTFPLQAFSEMDESLKNHPMIIMRAIKKFKDIAKNYNQPIYAIPSEKYKNSSSLLKRVGFKETEEGVYQWTGKTGTLEKLK